MKKEITKNRRDWLREEIKACDRILEENSFFNKDFSWKIFWIRVDAHRRRLNALRELND